MMMGTGSTTTMAMTMSSSTASASASSTGMSDMSSSSSDDSSSTHMGMNMYFTGNYSGYPIVFKTLSASSGAQAFGIFCILFFTAFFFRGISFLSSYTEQRVFQNYKSEALINQQHENIKDKEASISASDLEETKRHSTTSLTKPEFSGYNRSPLSKFLHVTPISIYRDLIRLLLTFVSTMIGYALMLAVMSFIMPYFFAVILGISFGEIFFTRLSIAFDINPPESVCNSLH